MAGEFIEFFTELMFGTGAWLGIIIILAITLLVAYQAKYSSAVWFMVLLMLNFEYWQQIGGEIDVSSNFMWSIIISYMGMALMAIILLRDLGVVGGNK